MFGLNAQNEEIVNMLLTEGKADPNLVCVTSCTYGTEVRATPLIVAARVGSVALCQRLVQAGAVVDWQDHAGWTALHWAAAKGHDGACAVLLRHKAAVDPLSHNGLTPLFIAAKRGYDKVVRTLAALGSPNVDFEHHTYDTDENKVTLTPLVAAVQQRHVDTVIALLELGAFIDWADDECRTALHWASILEHHELKEILMDPSAYLDKKRIEEMKSKDRWKMDAPIIFTRQGLIKAGGLTEPNY